MSERVKLSEISAWRKHDEDANQTVYTKLIQLNVELSWVPTWIRSTVIAQFKAASLQCRVREMEGMLAEVERRG